MRQPPSTACNKDVPPEDKLRAILLTVVAVLFDWVESEAGKDCYKAPDLLEGVDRLKSYCHRPKVTEVG